MSSRLRLEVQRILKVLVSGALLFYLFRSTDWGRALSALRDAHRWPLALAVVILAAQHLVSAWKWRISLSIHGLAWDTWPLLRILLSASFLNNFLPTAIGGDIYRVYRTVPEEGTRSRAVSAVLLDRVVGLLSLMLIGAIGSAWLFIGEGQIVMELLFVLLAAPPLVAALFPTLLNWARLQPLLRRLARIRKLDPLAHNAKLILAHRRGLLPLVLVSLLFQTLAAASIALLFWSVGVVGVAAESAVVGAMYALAAVLPISINGLGVMEGSFALTAQRLGIDFESAVVVSLTIRVMAVAISLIGGLVLLLDRGRDQQGSAFPREGDVAVDDTRTGF